jgi:UDP-N-acetylmuramoyl-L-alanyl-D-glutamate--2,6-diaminopimelate ligase
VKLTLLIKSLGSLKDSGSFEDFEVKGISCNSKSISSDFVFVAIKGATVDGHKFIKEAVGKGAKAVVVQAPGLRSQVSKDVSVIEVKDTHLALAKLAAQFYGNPSKKIKVVGITGTKGKTTITYLVEALLKEAGFNPAVIGTINYRFKDKVLPSKNTTPGPIELQSMLAEMLKAKVDYAIMEVSSHALDQERTRGIDFHSAIFSNLAQDHLDYHKTLENYFQAKQKLFKDIGVGSFAVINNDDEYGRRLKELTCAKVITYGIENQADVAAKEIKFDLSHTEFLLCAMKNQESFESQIIGRHNIYNILAVVAWGLEEGIKLSVIKSAVAKFDFVPGRLEKIESKSGFRVFVDYAHTEDSLKNVLETLRQLPVKRIIVVFGAGGDRDKTKRPKMGHVVSELADYAIITDDNPRSEEPLVIIEDIKKGIKKDNFRVIPDRREAIRESLLMAKEGDIVLIAGKGHENYQILKDKTIHFDDREVARECLKSMNY